MNWKDIPGYEGYYQVSDLGQVKSLAREIKYSDGRTIKTKEKLLKPRLGAWKVNEVRYYSVVLNKNGNAKQMRIHRLVAMLFCENDNPEINIVVNHIDNNPLNNVYTNLQWTTVIKNNEHRHKQGRSRGPKGESNRNSSLTKDDVIEIRRLLSEGKLSQQKISEMYGVGQTAISRIKLKQSWS